MRLWQALSADPGTVLAQEVETQRLHLCKDFPSRREISTHLATDRDRFARKELQAGFPPFLRAIDLLPREEAPLYCGAILGECGIRIQEFGATRPEYSILAILAMEKWGK